MAVQSGQLETGGDGRTKTREGDDHLPITAPQTTF